MRLAVAAILSALILLFVTLGTGQAQASRPRTVTEQAIVNILKDYLPEAKVDEIVRKADEIYERADLNNDEKAEAVADMIDKELNRAEKLWKEARGGRGQGLDPDRTYDVVSLLRYLRDLYDLTYKLGPETTEAFVRKNLAFKAGRLVREEIERLEEAKRKEAQKDGEAAPKPKDAAFSLEGTFVTGHLDLKNQSYLAIEPVPGTLIVGALTPDNDPWIDGFDVALRYAGEFSGFRLTSGPPVTHVIEPFFSYRTGDHSTFIGAFDPVGTGLGLPGTGDPGAVFPAGVFFGAFGPLNLDVAQDLRSDLDYQSIGGGLRFGAEFHPHDNLTLTPLLGLSLTAIDQQMAFGGSVPAYGVTFDYVTDIDLTRYGLSVSLEADWELGSGFSVYLEPSVGIDFVDADGRDRLSIVGPVGDAQSVSLDDDRTAISAGASLYFAYEPDGMPLKITVGGRVEHGLAGATVFRSGQPGEQTQLSIDYATSLTFGVGLVFRN